MTSPDRLLSSAALVRGWFDVLRLRLTVGGEECERDIIDHPSGSAVLPYDPDRRVALLVRETRAAVLYLGAPAMVEAVAGVVEDEGDAEGARREALEEAGVRLRELEPVGRVWMTPSSSTERVHLFLARYSAADRVAPGGGLAEEGEHLDVVEMPLSELAAQVGGDRMADAKTLLLVQALMLRRPELFG